MDNKDSTLAEPQIKEAGIGTGGRSEASYWQLLVVGVAALALRLAPLLHRGLGWAMGNTDSPRYVELAQGLRAGCGFATLTNGRCGSPEVLRTPGYPLFLLAMTSLRAALVCQAVLGAALCLLVGYFVFIWWGKTAALIAEALLAFDAPSIIQGSRILSDSLFQAMLAIAVIVQLGVIARGRFDRRAIIELLGAAFLLAASITVRPVGILLPLIAPLPFFFLPRNNWRKTIGCALCAFALPAISVGGWMARNAVETGVWTLSTDVALDLYYFKAGGVIWYRGHEDLPEVMDDLARRLGQPNARDFLDMPPGLTAKMMKDGERILLHDPLATMIMTVRSFIWLAFVPDRGGLNELIGAHAGAKSLVAAGGKLRERLEELFRSPLLTVLVFIQFVLNLIIWLGVVRAILTWRRNSFREIALEIIPLAIAVAMILLASGAEAYARYRMPAVPLLAIVAGVGWSGSRLRSSRDETKTEITGTSVSA